MRFNQWISTISNHILSIPRTLSWCCSSASNILPSCSKVILSWWFAQATNAWLSCRWSVHVCSKTRFICCEIHLFWRTSLKQLASYSSSTQALIISGKSFLDWLLLIDLTSTGTSCQLPIGLQNLIHSRASSFCIIALLGSWGQLLNFQLWIIQSLILLHLYTLVHSLWRSLTLACLAVVVVLWHLTHICVFYRDLFIFLFYCLLAVYVALLWCL